MSRSFYFSEGEYYHIYNRGVDKRIIFKDTQDKERFQKLLFLCNSQKAVRFSDLKEEFGGSSIYLLEKNKPLIDIGVYNVLSNHFHLLLREHSLNGISHFMQKLATAYTMYFNIKNQRSGSLFEGTYRAKHIKGDEYLKYLFSYIHLNPIEHIEPNWKEKGIKDLKKAKQYLLSYHFSSFQDYRGISRPESVILEKTQFPKYFEKRTDFINEIVGWLKFDSDNSLSSRLNLEDRELSLI